MNDLNLLRTYEPAIHYTLGEMFFPCAVDGYLQNTSLWLADTQRQTTCVAERGATDHDSAGRVSHCADGPPLLPSVCGRAVTGRGLSTLEYPGRPGAAPVA